MASNKPNGNAKERRRSSHAASTAEPSRAGPTASPTLKPNEHALRAAALAAEEADDVPTCWICAEPVAIYAVGPCNHRTCHVCSLRLRALYKKLECTFCKSSLDHIIFTASPDKPFEQFAPDATPWQDSSLGIAFETREQLEDALALLRFNCPDPTCEDICRGWGDLRRHVKTKHSRHMCDLCTRNQKIFAHEHTLFTSSQLKAHVDQGENASNKPETSTATPSGFTGHPLCEFCKVNYYDLDEIFKHLREKHEQCFICVRNSNGRMDYYADYPALEKHFNDRHYICDHPDCRGEKLTNVFETMLELQDHRVEKHGAEASKQAKRDARRIEINTTVAEPERPRAGPSRRHDDIPARRREDPHARPTFVAMHGSNLAPGRSVPGLGPSRRTRDDHGAGPSRSRPVSPGAGAVDSEVERHQALIHKVEAATSHSEAKTALFKSAVRAYRNSEQSAAELLDTCWNMFEHRMSLIEEVIKELASLLDTPGKRADLLRAWQKFHIDQDAFPSLAPIAPTLAGSGAAAALPRKAPAPLPKPQQTPARRVPGMGTSTAARNGQINPAVWARVQAAADQSSAFPALPASTRSKAAGTTAWSASAQGGSTPTRPVARASPAPAPVVRSLGGPRSVAAPSYSPAPRVAPPSRADFPDLPISATLEARAAAKRAAFGATGGAPQPWGSAARYADDEPVMLDGEANISKNKAILAQLLHGIEIAPLNQPAKPKAAPKKRVAAPKGLPGSRTSARQAGQKAPEYSNDLLSDGEYGERSDEGEGFEDDNATDEDDEDKKEAKTLKRKAPPKPRPTKGQPNKSKTFGHIPGTHVGQTWAMRAGVHAAGVHAPLVAGMFGDQREGCYSIALSGGYPEDIDEGYRMTFTGCGGRALKGTADQPKNLRTAPQSFDQSWSTPQNAALRLSAENGRPVRVIRGYKNPSPFAPVSGYKYDGIYLCEKAWMAEGETPGLKVCKFILTRLPGQPPITIHPDRKAEGAAILKELGLDDTGMSSPAKAGSATPELASSDAASGSEEEIATPTVEREEQDFSPLTKKARFSKETTVSKNVDVVSPSRLRKSARLSF